MMATPVRRRTRARELALQFLYAYEMRGEEAMPELDSFVEHHTKTGEAATNEPPTKDRLEIADYARELVTGVHDHLDEVNRWIEHIARNWRLDRMAYLDRNILRIALYELLHQSEVPFKVVINEAIDIAKRFSTAQSGSFVNGILDRARILIEAARAESGDPVPQAPAAGMEGQGAAESATSRSIGDANADLPEGAPVPRPARTNPATGAASGTPESTPLPADADQSTPQAGEFPVMGEPEYPAGEDLADPAALPRPRRRRRRRPGGTSDSDQG